MDKGASSTTDGTVADAHMIEVGVDFEANSTAVTRACVRLFHDA